MSTAESVAYKVAELCDESARLIEARGHARLVAFNDAGGMCATGAISVACRGESPREWHEALGSFAEEFVLAALAGHLDIPAFPMQVQAWNDEVASKSDVVRAFRATARDLRAAIDRRQVVIDTQARPAAPKPLSTDPRVVIPAPAREHAKVSV